MFLAKATTRLRLSNSICINTTVEAYTKAIRSVYGQRPFAKIKPGSKTAENCLKFVELAHSVGKHPVSLMKEALAFFDEDFCQRVFKRPYPMITVLISEKTIGRLHTQNKPTVKVTKSNFKSIVDQFWPILREMDPVMARDAVKGGWPEGAPEVRKELMRRLKNAAQN